MKGYNDAKYKKFGSRAEAEAYVAGVLVASTASPSGSRVSGPSQHPVLVEADEVGWDVVYSDGACKGNGTPGSVAGICVWWGTNDPR